MGEGLSRSEQIFALRMATHMQNGSSPEDAALAVIDDDARILRAFFSRGSSHYFPTADEMGRPAYTGAKIGDAITSEMAMRVYSALCAGVAA